MSKSKFLNRDLSWLSFNERVLMESRDASVPALERLRFLAIYSSNLDEFYRVRVADIRSLALVDKKKINRKAGLDPHETLERIRDEVGRQLSDYGDALNELLDELAGRGLLILRSPEEIRDEEREELDWYFKTQVLGLLRPVFLDGARGGAFLHNQALYLVTKLKKGSEIRFGFVNVPTDKLPRFYRVERNGGHALVFLEDLVRLHIGRVFPDGEVVECRLVKLSKDADLQIDDEYSGDLVAKIEKQIKKRDLGLPSRLLYEKESSDELLDALEVGLDLTEDDLIAGGRHHNLEDFWQVKNLGIEGLEFQLQRSRRHEAIDQHDSIFEAMDSEDQLLHFPYQSYDYVLHFFNEAATDPDVCEINVTFYRMAENSSIGEALISAARNGKKVFVFMELKARFDERNNLEWAQRFEDAGVTLVYSMPGLKVHAKVAQVTKLDSDGKKSFYGFFGTGNLNEKTAQIYSDFGLLSTHRKMNGDLARVFTFLQCKEEPEFFDQLIVSQFNALETFTQLIDDEIAVVRSGQPAEIVIKLNNIEERGLIRKLYEAAEAGVKVTLIARSICCVVPGTHGIRVVRLVGRYLEHARIFYFKNKGEPRVYLGSSDWMNRNLYRRIEVSFPIMDDALKEKVVALLMLQLRDNTKAVELSSSLENLPVRNEEEPVDAQVMTYELL